MPFKSICDIWAELVHTICGIVPCVKGASQDIFNLWLERRFIELMFQVSVVRRVTAVQEDLSCAHLRHTLFDPMYSRGSRAEDFSMIMLAREPAMGFHIIESSLIFGGFGVA